MKLPTIEIVVPVFNEERVLRTSITRLRAYLEESFPFDWRITIADNASTDGTLAEAARLAAESSRVAVLHLDEKGRGRALRAAWGASSADVVAYMDVDLSTGLDALLPLVAPLVSGHSDVAIGSRLAPGAAVARGPQREFISRCYNLLLRAVFLTRFRDAQCGFKAVRGDLAKMLVAEVTDDSWFFDTELLLLAEHNGLRVHEVPVDWIDDPDSRVDIPSTVAQDLRGVARMFGKFARGRGRLDLGEQSRPSLSDDLGRQFVGFATVGSTSTALTVVLFLWWREALGSVPAALASLSVTTLLNTWANRRFTFGHRTRIDRARQYAGIAASWLVGAVLTTAALLITSARSTTAEVLALLCCSAITAVLRFRLLRTWVFGPPSAPRGVTRIDCGSPPLG